jgi:hypothetical protein
MTESGHGGEYHARNTQTQVTLFLLWYLSQYGVREPAGSQFAERRTARHLDPLVVANSPTTTQWGIGPRLRDRCPATTLSARIRGAPAGWVYARSASAHLREPHAADTCCDCVLRRMTETRSDIVVLTSGPVQTPPM